MGSGVKKALLAAKTSSGVHGQTNEENLRHFLNAQGVGAAKGLEFASFEARDK